VAPLIRPLEPSDHPPIIAVVDEWWGGRRMAAMLPRLFFVHFRTTSFVAEDDGAVVGFLVGFVSPSVSAQAYVHFAGVHPAFRRRGVASALYRRFFSVVAAQGCRTVRCVTSPVNQDSVSFHRRLGFRPVDSATLVDGIPVFTDYDGTGEDRVLLQATLD
jgi:ribosomal protein S18 acetylase RimI-like enzyme